MIQTIKKNFLLVAAGLALVFAMSVAAAAPVSAATGVDVDEGVRCGSNIDLRQGGCDSVVTGGTDTVQDTIRMIINLFSIIVGAVAVVMIIVGGFRYVTSGGDSNNIGSAKNTILFAIVGLVIVAIAQAIVQFVLDQSISR